MKLFSLQNIVVVLFFFNVSCTLTNEKNAEQTRLTSTSESKIFDSSFGVDVYVKQLSSDKEKTMVLIHGLGDSASRDWSKLAPLFKDKYHVLMIDLPGFGNSGGELKIKPNPERYARSVQKIIDQFKRSEKVIMVGHSMGAAITLSYLHLFPNLVEKAILISTAGVLERTVYAKELTQLNSNLKDKNGMELRYTNIFNSYTNKMSNMSLELVSYAAKVTRKSRRKWFADDKNKNRGGVNVQAGLGLIRTNFAPAIFINEVATLILWGEKDRIASGRVSQILNNNLKNSAFHVIKNSGHVPIKEKPSEVYKIATKWLSTSYTSQTTSFPNTQDSYTCNNSLQHKTVTGSYVEVNILNCENLKLENITTEKLIVYGSKLEVNNMKITSDRLAVDIYDSSVKFTNLKIKSNEGLSVKKSNIDIAGADIDYKYSPIEAFDTVVRWSVSRLKQQGSSKNFYKHGEEHY